MNDRFYSLIGLLAALLLLGSFPVKSAFGSMPCDIMRIGGFILLYVYSKHRLERNKKK